MTRLVLAVAVVVVSGCALYWPDPQKTPSCDAHLQSFDLRNPQTDQCQQLEVADPCPCGGCGSGSSFGGPPDWAPCNGRCDGLVEADCLSAPGCQAAYWDVGAPSPQFLACRDVAPSGPVEGACEFLDAHGCSQHDDCVATYASTTTTFERCGPEPAVTCALRTCDAGRECAEDCRKPPCAASCVDPATAGACTGTVTCGGPPPACRAGTTAGLVDGCYSGYCIPDGECPLPACATLLTEAACRARADCDPIERGDQCTCDAHGCSCQIQTFERCQ